MTDTTEILTCDLVVLGAGMAGMTAAGRAAEAGANVVVIEKGAEIGGSALMSGSFVWTTNSARQMANFDDGDTCFHELIICTYPKVIDWIRNCGVHMNDCQSVLFGRGYQIDMLDYFKKSQLAVEKAGGYVARDTTVTQLIPNDGGDVVGLVAEHSDGQIVINCKAIILATGGYQGNPELRALYIHPSARHMPLRGNPHSQGDGLRLAQAVGGALAGPNPGFYGHLIAHPVEMKTESQFVLFSQYHSENGVLLNKQGKRFVDEGWADHESAQMTLREPNGRAVLVWDEKIQRENVMRPPMKGVEPWDRYAIAKNAGANGDMVDTIAGLLPFFSSIGYDGASCVESLYEYNNLVQKAPEKLHPTRTFNSYPMLEGPFYALEVEPAVTIGYAGLWVDKRTRVLSAGGKPINGLYAVGADVGNVYRNGYLGGLAFASTFGFCAAEDFLNTYHHGGINPLTGQLLISTSA